MTVFFLNYGVLTKTGDRMNITYLPRISIPYTSSTCYLFTPNYCSLTPPYHPWWRYGDDAGEATHTALRSVVNVVVTAYHIDHLGIKAFLKSAGKQTAKAMVKKPEGETAEPEGKEELKKEEEEEEEEMKKEEEEEEEEMKKDEEEEEMKK